MRLALIVQGHKNPEQIARLVRRVQSDDTRVWTHVTAVNKGLDEDVRRLLSGVPNVEHVPSQRMYYNHWSFMKAILLSIDTVLASGFPCDYIVLLTGQDYPLLARQEMLCYFERADGRSMLDYGRLPRADWTNGGVDRFAKYHFVIPKVRPHQGEYRFEISPPFARSLPPGFQLWGGSGYWGLSRSHAQHLMQIVRDTPALERDFRLSSVPDEMFVQSLLLSTLPHDEFICQPTSFAVWDKPGGPWPAILEKSDYQQIAASELPFARKFDATVDSEILDLLDQRAGEGPAG